MEPIEALRASQREFEARLALVEESQWALPTPCEAWTVRELVNHVLLGTRMTVELLAGGSREEVIARLDDDLVGGSDDPAQTFTELADQAHASFARRGGLEGTVSHPMGDIPRNMFIGFRIGDQTVHAWDLARAIGANEELDADLVAYAWQDMQPMRPMIAESGVFGEGPSGGVGTDAPLQTQYLDMLGRRP